MRYFVWLDQKNKPVGNPHPFSGEIDWGKRPKKAKGGIAIGTHLHLMKSYGLSVKLFEKWEYRKDGPT